MYLGSFEDFEQAARTHDRAAIKIHQHDAKLNYPLWDYRGELQRLKDISVEGLVLELRRKSDDWSDDSDDDFTEEL